MKIPTLTKKIAQRKNSTLLIGAAATPLVLAAFLSINDATATVLAAQRQSGSSTAGNRAFVPIVGRAWRPDTHTPDLFWIDNSDKDNYHTVQWSPVLYAEEYVLQEATDDALLTAHVVYRGPINQWTVPEPGRVPGLYHYRVKATGTWGESSWSQVRAVRVWPLFVGLKVQWDGKGFIRFTDESYDAGWHSTRECIGLTDSETIQCQNHNWYEPNPAGLDPEFWDSFYSVFTGRLKARSAIRDPDWKWHWYGILPYDEQIHDGQIVHVGGQPFRVSGPLQGYTSFGRRVSYWRLVNTRRFLFWDGGGDWRQYVHEGDATLWYDAGNTKLLLSKDVLRHNYYRNSLNGGTVQYIIKLAYASSFPGMGAWVQNSGVLSVPRQWPKNGADSLESLGPAPGY
jgi:hypothetical protein